MTGSSFADLTQFACLCMRNAITSLVCAWGATVSCCVQLGNFLPASARLHLFIFVKHCVGILLIGQALNRLGAVCRGNLETGNISHLLTERLAN